MKIHVTTQLTPPPPPLPEPESALMQAILNDGWPMEVAYAMAQKALRDRMKKEA